MTLSLKGGGATSNDNTLRLDDRGLFKFIKNKSKYKGPQSQTFSRFL